MTATLMMIVTMVVVGMTYVVGVLKLRGMAQGLMRLCVVYVTITWCTQTQRMQRSKTIMRRSMTSQWIDVARQTVMQDRVMVTASLKAV
jgi:hypothetical protein